MKLKEIINETMDTPETIDEVWAFIKNNCAQYIYENPSHLIAPMYRGFTNSAPPITVKLINQNRLPKDTPKQIHKIFVEAFKEAGIKANRDNSIFVTGDHSQASDYAASNVHVVYPIGDFDFSYSKDVKDLYMDLEKLFNKQLLIFDENQPLSFRTLDDFQWFMPARVLNAYQNSVKEKYGDDYDGSLVNGKTLTEIFELFALTDSVERVRNLYYASIDEDELKDALKVQELKVINNKLTSFVKSKYHTTDIEEAIESKSEILIHGTEYLAIAESVFFKLGEKVANETK